MVQVGNKPFAVWGDRDAPAECDKDGHYPAASCDCDSRWKWGYDGHYADGESVATAEIDPRLDGRAFIQPETDPYLYIDGDDVRDPKTGDVHPGFIGIFEQLGGTYTDFSQSGTGVHAVYGLTYQSISTPSSRPPCDLMRILGGRTKIVRV